MNTTFKRTIYLGIAGLSVILFIIGSFYDLPIAQAVYRPNHPAALVFSVIGLYLFFGAFEVMAGSLCRQLLNLTKSKAKRILILIVCSYTGFSTAVLGSMGLVSDSVLGLCFPDVTFTFWHNVVIGLIVFYPLVFLGMLMNGKRAEPSTIHCLLLLLCILTLTFFGQIGFSELYCRPRFRITQLGCEELHFQPWYAPLQNATVYKETYHLKSDALRSFFSGHALDAVLNLAIFPAFAMVFTRLEDNKCELQIAAFVLIPLIVFSRMVLGAHYLSDVSAGMLCVLGFVVLYEFLAARLKHWKHEV